MNSRQLNAVIPLFTIAIALSVSACDDPVGKDKAPSHVTGKVFSRLPDENSTDGEICNTLALRSDDGSIHVVCVSNADYDRNPLGTVYTR